MAAIEALGRIGGTKVRSLFCISALKMKTIAAWPALPLKRQGTWSSIEHLLPFLKEEEVRELALQAIVGIAEREKNSAAWPSICFCRPH